MVKTQQYYEPILVESKSALQHVIQNNSNTIIAFTKLEIIKVISQRDWGYDLYESRNFNDSDWSNLSYNYDDYIQACMKFAYAKIKNIRTHGGYKYP